MEKSKHIEKMEAEGHHIHEAPLINVDSIWNSCSSHNWNWYYWIIMQKMEFIKRLQNILKIPLAYILIHHESVESSILPGFFQGLNPVALGSSLVAFAIGFGLGYIFYIGRWVDPVKFVNSKLFFYSLHKIILNQMVS